MFLSRVGMNGRQCAARTELFSVMYVVTLDWLNVKKQMEQCIGRLVQLTEDLLYTPSELLSSLGKQAES